jgi:ATP-dependent Lon protease
LKKRKTKAVISDKTLEKYLGVRKHRFGLAEEENQVGEVTGLAWTSVGGDLLTIEATAYKGKGRQMVLIVLLKPCTPASRV